jgi:hypothetical protein
VYIGIIVRNDGALKAGKKLYISVCGLCIARDRYSLQSVLITEYSIADLWSVCFELQYRIPFWSLDGLHLSCPSLVSSTTPIFSDRKLLGIIAPQCYFSLEHSQATGLPEQRERSLHLC